MKAHPALAADLGEALPDAALGELHRKVARCSLCVAAGLLSRSAPVLPVAVPSRVVLVGQAPGRVEEVAGRPFSGRAGRQLFGWLSQAGLGPEPQARRSVYLTSVTKCFPGPGAGGSGDRRPSRAEVALCGTHLDRQLQLLRPRLVLAVGQLALERFLPRRRLGEVVGRLFDPEGAEVTSPSPPPASPLILPLPHPSGASRWLNRRENRALLQTALERLSQLISDLGLDPSARL